MRSSAQSSFATLLLLVPVLTVPLLAIFGIPQFAPAGSAGIQDVTLDDFESPDAEAPLDDLISKREGRQSTASGGQSRIADAAQTSGSVKDLTGSRSTLDEPFADAGSHAGHQLPDGKGAAASWEEENPFTGLEQTEPGEDPLAVAAARSRAAAGQRPIARDRMADAQGGGAALVAAPVAVRQPGAALARSDLPNGGAKRSAVVPVGFENAGRAGGAKLAEVDRGVMQAGGIEPQSYRRQDNERGVANREAVRTRPDRPPLTWQGAVARLNELEIRNFRLEPGLQPGQFVFICSYTPADRPRLSYRFEAEGNQPLIAVDKVLEQIEEWVAGQGVQGPGVMAPGQN